MRTTVTTISLTLLPFLLSFFIPHGNLTLSGGNDTHQNCMHAHTFASDNQLRFGSELGKYIKENSAGGQNYTLKTIVIDPGHGGRDPGTSGQYTREKHLTLGISKMLGDMLKAAYPNLNIIFTRTEDTFIPLHERASVANKNKADLFLSIHCNYMPKASHIRGTETYVMGLHTTDFNLEVAKRENASILLEDDYSANYGGFDPNSPEGHIILSMFQNAFLEQSISLADKLENRFAETGKRHSRGVKQAGFAVLKSTTMPSVLVETGFLSNTEEEKFLATPEGQYTIARSIAEAFVEYKNEVEGNNEQLPRLTARAPVLGEASGHTATGGPKTEPLKPVETQTQASEPVAELLPSPPADTQVHENEVKETPKGPVTYKVLILKTPDPASVRQMPWEKVRDLIEIKKTQSTYAYFATGFQSYQDAARSKDNLRALGFTEAFVVAFQDGKRIPISQARENSER